jgi:PAS domain S-box-containing protein
MSTNNGLSAFDPVKQTFRNYSTADGLPGADLSGWGACYKSPNGEMLFGGYDGGVAFSPDKVVDSLYVPKVVLTDFRLFDRAVAIGRGSPLSQSIGYTRALTLSHQENVFSVEFSALSYFNSATNRYRYKLDPLDRQWYEVGSNRRLVTYTTLPAGLYTFHVQGATSRGAWSEPGVELQIEILPPWWGTWWFRILCTAACLGTAWIFYRFRISQIRHQERKLRDVIETIPTFAWTALPDGSVDFVNWHWKDYTGLSTENTVGAGWQDAVHVQDLERHIEKWRASLATGSPFESEVRYRRIADAEYRWFLTRAVPLRDESGRIVKWYGISTDIEDRKRAEQEREQLRADLAHVNRISTLGELAASISHELKQPITATILRANTVLRCLRRDPPNVSKANQTASKIIEDGTRASEIIDRLRSLYRKSPPKRESISVNAVICEIVGMFRGEAARHAVSIQPDLDDNLPNVIADRVQIQQVLMNLLLNGVEAMQGTGGTLMLQSRLNEDGQIHISVNDTGPGLPPGKADQIFDAFFTTKPQGSGMGLAISKSIVESHGGRIWANGKGGSGATFHFTLPPAPAEAHLPTDAALEN